ncbi:MULTISPECIES: hypothetical protein [Micrococcus]|nr:MULTISPECIES: hypothetical protein [Micrococcus]MCV7608126.1 hypothetical protein [Micrococcus luteus]MCV7682179.1 hypothetical protein [Micrococcus luteus]MCV7700623.1 hypothetical protein [Micrococcus luteus]MCZ4069613.1 hypothetical protein [Micrococcus sp. H39-S4]
MRPGRLGAGAGSIGVGVESPGRSSTSTVNSTVRVTPFAVTTTVEV